MSDLDNTDINLDPGGPPSLEALEAKAAHVAARLSVAANPKRLLILCHLAKLEREGPGEASVGALMRVVDLSQSALSQHLARLRAVGMVATRREGQTIFYRLADDETRRLMAGLYDVFCADA